MPVSPSRRVLLAAAVTLAGLIATAAPTSAASATSCADQPLEQPFLPWLDPATYTLAPDGAIEDGAGSWELSGGATPAAGNEPFHVHGAGDGTSLALPAGSSATSGPMCVGLEHPTARFFAKRTGGSLLGSLRVDVIYEGLSGETRSLPIGLVLNLSSSWQPTLPMPLVANLLALAQQDGHTDIALRFVPQGDSSWAIDDVYVDPFRRH